MYAFGYNESFIFEIVYDSEKYSLQYREKSEVVCIVPGRYGH